MSQLPTGTVTFLFTDIEGSTRLWQEKPQAMAIAHARHDAILRKSIEANRGYIFQIVGDSFSAAFHNAVDGLRAAYSAQQRLQAEPWGEVGAIRVRMGLHSGAAEIAADGSGKYPIGYATIASAQRVMSAAHGGQVLVSQTTGDLLQNELPAEAALRDMGEHRLKDLRSAVKLYQLAAPGLAQDFPPIRSLDSLPNNLPVQLTSFIGREKEIGGIKDLLAASRLVTLTGSGGTGKTRLAQEVGAQVLADFAHGVWLVELAPLSDPGQIIPALAQVFGLQELPFTSLDSQVRDYLREKKLLLILDNCEHLIDACARLADELLRHCAGLKILASSREALGISGEAVYRVPSLAEVESAQLFAARAEAANSNFKLTEANSPPVAQICRRLDGIPLAIELAAARVKLLSPEQIARRLDDRFRLLIGGSRTALPRQQTLRALIDWSYDLLSEEEKHLLQFASVFIGGWTLEALEAVAEDANTIEHLEGLVNKSLVVTEVRGSEMRYFMLETIRQYAREKLFEAELSSAARDRHFFYFGELSDRMWNAFFTVDIFPMRDRADDELDNIRAALDWGLDNHVESAAGLAANFCMISDWMSNQSEGIALCKTAVERLKDLPPAEESAEIERQKLIARALFAQGISGLGTGNMPYVQQVLREAIAISRQTGDKRILGYSLEIYYTATMFLNAPGGEEAAREGLHIFREEINDHFGLGISYLNMSRLAASKGDQREKEMYFGKLRGVIDQMPGTIQVGFFFLGMGLLESSRGNNETAKKLFEDGLGIFTRIRATNFQIVLKSELGHIARRSGDLTQAREIYLETLRGWQDLGNRSAIAHQLECFGILAINDEQPERAVKLFAAAEALRERITSPRSDLENTEYDQSIDLLTSILAVEEYQSLRAEGCLMTMEQAIQLALEE